jgi:hypothetical protein
MRHLQVALSGVLALVGTPALAQPAPDRRLSAVSGCDPELASAAACAAGEIGTLRCSW